MTKVSYHTFKRRINSLNFFVEGIRPEWEDQQNNYGHTLTLEFKANTPDEIPNLLNVMQKSFTYLILLVLGESIVGAEFVSLN